MLGVRGHRVRHALAHAVSLVVPATPALPLGSAAAPSGVRGCLGGKRVAHYSAYCPRHVRLAGCSPEWLPFAGRLDRLFAGGTWLDCLDPAVPPLRDRSPLLP